MGISTGDSVTIAYTGRLDDGTVFDTSRESVAEEAGLAAEQPDREYSPLTFEAGAGTVIEGLEEALMGLEEGDTETVTIPPEKAYGEASDERVAEYDLASFTEMLGGEQPAEGTHVQTQDGTVGEVVHVGDVVRVDFNHELAGESLEFEVEIIEVE